MPVLKISGDIKGEGRLSLGVDRLIHMTDKASEIRIALSLEAASHDGLSTIFTSNGDGVQGEKSWLGGLDVTYTRLQSKPGFTAIEVDPVTLQEERSFAFACLHPAPDPLATMSALRESGGVWPTAQGLDEATIKSLDAHPLCRDGTTKFADVENTKKLPLPRRQLSFGFRLGRSEMAQLTAGSSPLAFSKTTQRKPRFAAGMTYTAFSPKRRLTFELPATLESVYEAANQKARWCSPAGMVLRPDGSGSDAAEVCAELPLGDPHRNTSLHVAAYLGFVGDDANWRASVGPTLKYAITPGTDPYEIGLEAPVYLIRATSQFSGVVRVTPAALLTRDADGRMDTKVLLTIALLGDRTLFATALH